MTYSVGFRAQVIKNVKQSDMSIRQACTFYNVSKTALQSWLKDSSKKTWDKSPTKIPTEALLKDVEQYPDDYYLYERARRFNFSKTGMHAQCFKTSRYQSKKRP